MWTAVNRGHVSPFFRRPVRFGSIWTVIFNGTDSQMTNVQIAYLLIIVAYMMLLTASFGAH